MAALHELTHALRNNFVDESTNIQLSQILTFIKNYITIGARNKGKEVAKKQ